MTAYRRLLPLLAASLLLTACGAENNTERSQQQGSDTFERVDEPAPITEKPDTDTETPDRIGFCPAVVDPVCGWVPANIQCVTEPCPSHEYLTFNNACEADLADAVVVLETHCGDLEDTLTFGESPAQVISDLPEPPATAPVIGNVDFDGDLLHVELGYSGCSETEFALHIHSLFLESAPAQVNYQFSGDTGMCLAAFLSHFTYDLKPLKQAYQNAYNTSTGTIVLPGLGTYNF